MNSLIMNMLCARRVADPDLDMYVGGPELCVVIPTFNEKDNVVPLIERLRACLKGIAWEVIFVDDDSRDGTLNSVHDYAASDRRIRGMRRVNRRGLSGACIEGMLATSAPVVAVMDADLQHDETCLPKMLDTIQHGQVDMVVATRFENQDDRIEGLTALRQAGSRLAIEIAQRILRVEISDPMSGFFMARRSVVEAVAPKLSHQGFKILLDIIASSPRSLLISEISYVFKPRIHGESKLDSSVVLEYVGLILAKASGDLISTRMVSFCLVGTSGLFVHLAVLWLLLMSGMSFPAGQTVAMFAAILSNYSLNNALTYRDRRRRGRRFLSGLVLFAGLCSIGVVAGVGVSTLFYNAQPRWWLDGLAGAIIGVGWNYITSSTITWRKR